MDWSTSPENLETLSQCFLRTLSPDPEPRRRAESYLSDYAARPGFGLAVLRLVSLPNVDGLIRIAAAINFKNHLRSHWTSSPDPRPYPPISDAEKSEIKSHISQLREALAVIGKHDFPKSWPTLLPDLVAHLQAAQDYAPINGILSTANSIFKKFRYEWKTNDLLLDLKYCLDEFAAPLLEIFLKTASLVPANLNSADTLGPLIESQRLCCRIFYSLNFQELPEFFEDHMNEWMVKFQRYLMTTYPVLEDDKSGNGVAIVDGLRAAVCENINLYMEKNEEEFKGYLPGFASAVWSLLMTASASSSRDRLTVTAIKFLTMVSTGVYHALFSDPNILLQIFDSIDVPNIRIREEDEELFEMNYVEYIRRDIEGSGLDTRRRIACELLKGIAKYYRDRVKEMVSMKIQNLLASYGASPAGNWKEKDCAIYLVVSLAIKTAGGSMATTDLVEVERFFATVIVPELKAQDVNGFPMLKADALKFFTTFRNHILKPFVVTMMPDVIRFLQSESNVVHSYAANCIEKLLLVKDEGCARYTSLDINPLVPLLLPNLFNALKFPESQENLYVMKCIMRVLGVVVAGCEIAGACITNLTAVLSEVCKNPKNPFFNHYLFEVVAALVRRSCEKDPSLISVYEASLFPVLQTILVNDVTEFMPYTFQILAQLVDIHMPPLPPNYMQLFELLLSPESWKRKANVPALVRLLQAFLQKAAHELNNEGRLPDMLRIFNQLVSASNTEELGFYMLNTIIENLSYKVISPYIGHIWIALFKRLENNRTLKFVKPLVIFMSLFLVKHGHEVLLGSIDVVRANIFEILELFWIPNLKLITGTIEMKLTSEIVEDETEVPDIGEAVSYGATFVHLYNAGKKEEDPLKEVKDPREFLVTSLARLSASSPGKYPAIIRNYLDQDWRSPIVQWLRLIIFANWEVGN
ncbi:hypothetical protein MRB53_032004 [Persea americana]|uniref:Uncharacterized protein n=1 Tax=Persea americana TaxID=3435 RepID=A0ACC2KQN9_PERAE|nr:hypothetical protein MRB53_032004 [Persea americana]